MSSDHDGSGWRRYLWLAWFILRTPLPDPKTMKQENSYTLALGLAGVIGGAVIMGIAARGYHVLDIKSHSNYLTDSENSQLHENIGLFVGGFLIAAFASLIAMTDTYFMVYFYVRKKVPQRFPREGSWSKRIGDYAKMFFHEARCEWPRMFFYWFAYLAAAAVIACITYVVA